MSPMGAEDGIRRSEMGADTDRDRLLPDIGMTRTVDQPALVATRELFLAQPNELHLPVETEGRSRPTQRRFAPEFSRLTRFKLMQFSQCVGIKKSMRVVAR